MRRGPQWSTEYAGAGWPHRWGATADDELEQVGGILDCAPQRVGEADQHLHLHLVRLHEALYAVCHATEVVRGQADVLLDARHGDNAEARRDGLRDGKRVGRSLRMLAA